jgi:ribosomal protein S18 acetylase RimI-like enzyme
VEVTRGTLADLDDVEPLWRALGEHHRELAPAGIGTRDPDEAWRIRRAQYEGWLADGRGTLLLAREDGRAVGYAMVTVEEAGPATWDLGDCTGEIETLSVLPETRSSGVGHALMEAARAVGEERGATALFVGVAATNADALRFYAREGYGDFYVQLVRRLEA